MALYSPSSSSVASLSEVSTAPTTPVAGEGPSGPPYVLVLGGLGFIGSHTALELLKAGHNVVIVDDLSNSFSNVQNSIREAATLSCSATGQTMPSLKFHEMDYCSPGLALVLESYNISGVIHFAAFKSVSESIASPLDYYMNNVCGLVSLLKLLGSYGIKKFVFSSSATVYGTKAEQGIPLREEDVVHHPLTYERDGETVTAIPGAMGLTSPYGRSKYFGEAILADLAYSDPSWNILALRYFNPIGCDASGLLGEDPRGVPTNLFPVLAQVLTGDRPQLEIFGSDWDTRDGTAVRDFIHVSDLARGHIAALDAKVDEPFRTFNLGTGTGTTVSEALGALEAASGRPIPAVRAPRREGDVGSCVAANSRATTELGWSTTESLRQSARDLWGFVSRVRAIRAI